MFVPTMPPSSRESEADSGLGRLDLILTNTTDYSPGILVIGAEHTVEPQTPPSGSSKEAPYGSWLSPVSSDLVVQPVSTVVEPPRTDPVTGE